MAAIIHTATYNGRCHTVTKTQWIDILNTNGNALDKLLKQHGTMQAVIQAEFMDQERNQAAVCAFIYRQPRAQR